LQFNKIIFMKIALIRKEYDPLRGGAERYAVNLARGLAGRGHDVHVFAGLSEPENRSGITLHRVPFVKRPSPLKNISFQRNSCKLVAEQSFDIVQGLSQVFPGDIYRMGEPLHIHWLQLSHRNPLKRLLKYLSPRHMAILAIERNIFRTGSYRRIIAISKLCRQQLMHYYGVPEKAIRLIYNGVDLQQFNTAEHGRLRCAARARLSIPASDPVLLFAGNDFKRKGLQFALQYALALRSRGHNPWLLVAGRGRQAPYERMAHHTRFADRLVFLGDLPDIREAYHCADLLVHPALYEPFGNVCIEAMACGLPVATSRLTGAADIIDNGTSGIVAERPWDIEEIVSDIAAALDHDRAGLKDMAERASQRAAEFPLERNVQDMLAQYREILSEKGVPQ
jgi:UDP-glucose:(heptosyl)LPS alpha-1,3-glucosyltransferase